VGGLARTSVVGRPPRDVSPEVAPEVTVRAATVDDVPGIHELETLAFSDPWTPASFRAMIAQPLVIATVAEQAGRIVGYCIAWAIGDEAELVNLCVAPALRGTGLGGRMLDGLLATLDGRGGATVYLEVRDSNEAAQALYRGRGFLAAGRRKAYYRHPAEDAVVMRRPGAVGGGGD
jgi:ribosomal-protein-alanine N-acetyltransferase